MLAKTQSRPERRGIVLVLVLAMLGLLALVGVTFATFSGQSRVNNRNYQQSLLQPQADELLDYGLQQLIADTNDIRSSIRGHSLLRDMYGTGSTSNGFLAQDPDTGLPFYIMGITQTAVGSTLYNLNIGTPVNGTMTAIASNDLAFFGFNFTRWLMRVSYAGTNATGVTGTVSQTFEILFDSGFNANSSAGRTFRINIGSTDGQLLYTQATNGAFALGGTNSTIGTNLYNPTPSLPNFSAGFATDLPGQYLAAVAQTKNNLTLGTAYPFQLDGRWLHAFNGPGIGATTSAITGFSNAIYGNFRFNGLLNPPPPNGPYTNFSPNTVGMDEDYDACDLENWFLAIQSADGQVMIPSFHRPAVVRFDPNNATTPVNDWQGINPAGVWADSSSRILRPRNFDGHDASTFPDLLPDAATGKINYDVDNDGDGVTDSVWVDLGYPARADASGRLFKPLFAFMVIGLNGRIPLNTAGNLAGNATAATVSGGGSIGGGGDHASHLGNSVSEVDPLYALQNASDSSTLDPTAAFSPPEFGVTLPLGTGTNYLPNNSQVDNTGIDVRLTQFRNLLAGTRPQANPNFPDLTGTVNGDNNYVFYSTGPSAESVKYYIPNGIVDTLALGPAAAIGSQDVAQIDSNNGSLYVVRSTQPVGGRWGEAQAVPGNPFTDPLASVTPAPTPAPPALVGVVGPNWSSGNTTYTSATQTFLRIPNGNSVRAGYSMDIGDIINGLPRDAADDNFNAFDPFPVGHLGENLNTGLTPNVIESDMFDVAGALLLPVDRMRRWLTPADINGTGSITTWSQTNRTTHRGPDVLGRVEYSSYFRPPGAPGAINVNYTATAGVAVPNEGTLGQIYYPNSALAIDPFYAATPSNQYPAVPSTTVVPPFTPYAVNPTYVPDLTNNPLHSFESFRFPNQNYPGFTPSFTPQQLGGSPVDLNEDTTTFTSTSYPTYDGRANANVHSDGLNEADEMNLYSPNPLLDSPFGPADLEWLYRQQDVDGATLTSRLSSLAPISFTNGIDGQRRRRLFALDSWDTNNFVWTNDNPGNAFPSNSTFTQLQSAGFPTLGAFVGTPSLAQRDKKINLNYPLPVSNDPNEPIRQKWITDTYQLLKAILPPKAVDTPEELAQLSQFVINIIDFRDPDCTMTHWVNNDVKVAGILAPTVVTGAAATPLTAPYLVSSTYTPPATVPPTTTMQLDQYGMEYNPVAINEILAYSYVYYTGTNTRANRFFAELVSTLTSPELSTVTPPQTPALASAPSAYYNTALNIGGYQYLMGDPYSGGAWDVVFTADDAYSRPDPLRGQLNPYGNTFGLTPLNRDSFSPNLANAAVATEVQLTPLGQASTIPIPVAGTAAGVTPAKLPTNYFYAFGNAPLSTAYDLNAPSTSATITPPATVAPNYWPNTTTGTGITLWGTGGQTPATLIQNLTTTIDPINGPNAAAVPASPILLYQGVLPAWNGNGPVSTPAVPNPSTTALPVNYTTNLQNTTTMPNNLFPAGSGGNPGTYFWMCLRRPANPFAPVSANNPMIVVDSVRFPWIDATATITKAAPPGGPPNVPYATANAAIPNGTAASNTVYSVQRFQPYRGGHAVPVPQATPTTPIPLDTRYGFSEQIVVPSTSSQARGTAGIYYIDTTATPNNYYYGTQAIYHTIGWANEFEQGSTNPLAEDWDFFQFHDRDFTSVAELMLVPGCAPGLFTKQFVEFAPSYANITNIFGAVLPQAGAPTGTGPPTGVPNPALETFPLVTTATALQAYSTGSTPLAIQTGYPASATPPTPPIQPHTFPYLIDKFFYSAYGQSNTLDPGGQVGGYAADGWFKMFEFLEVPSQMNGAIGPVANGVNFDWARQDSKPGLLNLNLIVDEEVFFSVAGQQTLSQQNGQYVGSDGTTAQNPSDQFTQRLLNFDQVTLQATIPTGSNPLVTLALGQGNYTATGGTLPLAAGTPPIPMVVTSTQAGGGPASAYPLFNTSSIYSAANLDNDPINNYGINTIAALGLPTQYTANLKAAWVQFLTARHGGSGYIFGFGNGAVGQNVAIGSTATIPGYNGVAGGAVPGPLPAERPFHSLSYPDIDFTIMRPAALPPGVTVNTSGALPVATFYTIPNANPVPATPAAALYGTALPAAGLTTPWQNPYTYSLPNLDLATPIPLWNTFVGDPGVRNYLLYSGYPSATVQLQPALLPTGWTMNVPTPYLGYPGTPTPAPPSPNPPTPPNAVAPAVGAAGSSWPVYPPPIPVRRLFQAPDAYNNAVNLVTPAAGSTALALPVIEPAGTAPAATSVSPSNASETGDPTINMVSVFYGTTNPPALPLPTGVIVPVPAAGALPPIFYTNTANNATYAGVLTNSVLNLYWPISFTTASATAPSGGAAAATMVNLATPVTAAAVGLPTGVGSNVYYGFGGTATNPDNRQHPLWRIEQLHHLMNLTTTRTHQYAVWITIGFFEIKRQGDLAMFAFNPQLAFDIMGPEIGAANGKSTRYRGFYLVDRLQLTGFNPASTSNFRAAVTYRNRIQ